MRTPIRAILEAERGCPGRRRLDRRLAGRRLGDDWEAANVTDGWNWRQPDGSRMAARPPSSPTPSAFPAGSATPSAVPTGSHGAGEASPWWSDATRDPWR